MKLPPPQDFFLPTPTPLSAAVTRLPPHLAAGPSGGRLGHGPLSGRLPGPRLQTISAQMPPRPRPPRPEEAQVSHSGSRVRCPEEVGPPIMRMKGLRSEGHRVRNQSPPPLGSPQSSGHGAAVPPGPPPPIGAFGAGPGARPLPRPGEPGSTQGPAQVRG